MAKKRGLNKGLDALLGGVAAITEVSEAVPVGEQRGRDAGVLTESESLDGVLRHLPIEFIKPGRFQPRRDIHTEALEELAQSIKAQGVMQPIVVRPVTDSHFEIIAGERRWRASQLAELDAVPCVIRDVADSAALAMALIENIQREDLNPMEEAIALDRLKNELSLTHQQVAEAVGKSRATITNLLRLMSLSEAVKVMLERGDLEMGHARALLALTDQDQVEAARRVVAKSLSVRQTEALVKSLQATVVTTRPKQDPNVKHLVDDLADKLGAAVQIQCSAKGKGKLVVNFSSLDELDGILEHIQ